ncbi:MAG: peptide chain release factor N(5)-glutamine methyltransferase [Treponemataceae bacterium]|nr:peptide chain release factor N(5)-glutamine methyltransferase [Treponemataceae bacterium]
MRQTPQLDVDLILCHVLGVSRTWLFLHNNDSLTDDKVEEFEAAIEKRLSGLPVAYIIGEKEFYGRSFYVNQDVLIPKPDTELLVEHAVAYARPKIAELSARAASGGEAAGTEKIVCQGPSLSVSGQAGPFRFADICTGSGCIVLSVLAELSDELQGGEKQFSVDRKISGTNPLIQADATDISSAALEVARKNADKLLSGEASACLRFFQGDLCRPLMSGAGAGGSSGGSGVSSGGARSVRGGLLAKYDMVLSNPPYVPADVTEELLKDGRGEPRLALDGDTDSAVMVHGGACDGLAIIRRLIPQVKEILLPGGVFFMETGEYNAEKASEYLSKCGFTDIVIHRDLAGQLRLVESHV